MACFFAVKTKCCFRYARSEKIVLSIVEYVVYSSGAISVLRREPALKLKYYEYNAGAEMI